MARLRALEARIAVLESIIRVMETRPQFRKKDLARKFSVTVRTIENGIEDGRLPKPIYVFGPMWTAEQIAGVVWR